MPPLDGSLLPLAPYEVVFHCADPVGVQQGEFRVNGQVLSSPVNTDANSHLVTFRLEWMPVEAGEYTLQVRALNTNGIWSDYAEARVRIAASTLTTTSTFTPLPTFTPTSTLTPTLTPTSTFTPTMVTWLFSNSTSPTEVYQGNCGPNQITFQVRVSPSDNVRGMLVFTRLKDKNGSGDTGWDSGTPMGSLGNGVYSLKLGTEKLHGAGTFFFSQLLYQFIATDSNGQVLSRSPTYDDVTVKICTMPLPTLHLPRLKTPTPTPQIVK